MSVRRKSRYLHRLLPVWVTASCCIALAPAPAASQPSPEDRGRHALETRCARCHAIGLVGESSHPEAPPFREVMGRYPPEELEEALAEGITSGHPDMPEFILSPDEIADVVRYLHTLAAP